MELKCVTSVTCNFTVRHISAILILIYANCNVLPFYDLCKLTEYCINRAGGGVLNITENQPFDLANKMPSEVHLEVKKESLKCSTSPEAVVLTQRERL